MWTSLVIWSRWKFFILVSSLGIWCNKEILYVMTISHSKLTLWSIDSSSVNISFRGLSAVVVNWRSMFYAGDPSSSFISSLVQDSFSILNTFIVSSSNDNGPIYSMVWSIDSFEISLSCSTYTRYYVDQGLGLLLGVSLIQASTPSNFPRPSNLHRRHHHNHIPHLSTCSNTRPWYRNNVLRLTTSSESKKQMFISIVSL